MVLCVRINMFCAFAVLFVGWLVVVSCCLFVCLFLCVFDVWFVCCFHASWVHYEYALLRAWFVGCLFFVVVFSVCVCFFVMCEFVL